MTVKEVYEVLCSFAPVELREEWDNVGLLAGRRNAPVATVLVALDITCREVLEAEREGAQLLVAHHPLFWNLTSVTEDSAEPVVALLNRGMSAICMHTNLDAAQGGVNDTLVRAVGLTELSAFGEDGRPLEDAQGRACGPLRVGTLPGALSAAKFAEAVKASLRAPGVQVLDTGRPVHRVGLCSGSGGALFSAAAALGCDTFLTGEAKHSLFLEARERGVNLLAAGHYSTEQPVCETLARVLAQSLPGLRVVKAHSAPPYTCI